MLELVFMAVTHSYHYCRCVSQVHKEYSKCLRHSYCCSRTSTSSSHGSLKNSGLRTNNRYYSSSQTRHAAAHRQVRHSANLFPKITFSTLRAAHKDINCGAFLRIWFPPSFQIPTQIPPSQNSWFYKTSWFIRIFMRRVHFMLFFHLLLCTAFILPSWRGLARLERHLKMKCLIIVK